MINKKDFFAHMSELYDEDYSDTDSYKTLKTIVKIKNETQIKELRELLDMDTDERLAYRHSLAAHGRELTPKQVDQYLSMIEYALSHMDNN